MVYQVAYTQCVDANLHVALVTMNNSGFAKFWSLPAFFDNSTTSPPPSAPQSPTTFVSPSKKRPTRAMVSSQSISQSQLQGPLLDQQSSSRQDPDQSHFIEQQEALPLQILDMGIKGAKSVHISPNNTFLLCVGERRWVVS